MTPRRVRVERGGNAAFPLAQIRERPARPFRWFRALLLVVLLLALAFGGAVAALQVLIDPVALKAQAEAILRQATGRELRIDGNFTVISYFGATVAVDDVKLANRAGFAQPDMLRIARLEVELSIPALLTRQIDIQRLVVVQPDLLLEIDASGRANWQPETPSAASSGAHLPLHNIHLKDGRLTVKDARTGRTTTITLRRISASESDAAGQLAIAADLLVGNQRVGVTGQVGTLARLLDRDATTPWSLRLALETQGARLSAAGSFTKPLELAGYALRLDASVADTAALAAFSPVRLPQMRTVVAPARIADNGSGLPDIAGVRVQIGASDFSSLVPGLKLDALDVNMPGLEQSLRGEFLGTLQGVPVRLQVALGGIAAFLPDAANRPDHFAFDITADAGESKLTVKGSIAGPATRTGLDVAVAARVRDLELLSPLAGQRLPALRNLAFEGRLADGAGGFAQGVVLHGFSLSLPQGDLAGDLAVQYGTRPSLRGTMRGATLDADALHALISGTIGSLSVVAFGRLDEALIGSCFFK